MVASWFKGASKSVSTPLTLTANTSADPKLPSFLKPPWPKYLEESFEVLYLEPIIESCP